MEALFITIIVVVVAWKAIAYFLREKANTEANTPAAPLIDNEAETQSLVLQALRAGQELPRMQVPGFLPKAKEFMIWAFPKAKHFHQGTHSEWVGQSRGVSVRIVKGLWWRAGASQGHRVSHSEMDYKGQGWLIITNQAFCFLSSTDSVRIPFKHIVGFRPYSDGIELQTDYARNPLQMFTNLRTENVAFLQSALDVIHGNPPALENLS
jgi:hypothetical protein